MHDAEGLLDKLGLDYEEPKTGCCGMAGSFGFEAGEKYEVSQKVGERVLLPKVRETPKDTLLIADGFSCREQISQNTDRHALHMAQVVRMARVYGAAGPAGEYPERGWVTSGLGKPPTRWGPRAAVVGVGLLLGGLRLLWHRPLPASPWRLLARALSR